MPILLIFIAMAAAYLFGLQDYVNLEALKAHRAELNSFVLVHFVAASFLFIFCHIAINALSLPLDGLFCATAGFLFPQPLSTLYAITAIAIGSSILFFATKTAFGETLRQKAGPRLKYFEEKFQSQSTLFLLSLRFIPVFPTWVVNIAAGLFGIPYFRFLWTTSLGLIPATFIFTEAGTGLGALLDAPGPPSLRLLFSDQLLWVVAIMTAIGLLTFLYQLFKKKR